MQPVRAEQGPQRELPPAAAPAARAARTTRRARVRVLLVAALALAAALAAAALLRGGSAARLPPVSHPQSTWARPGARPLADAVAAALVTRRGEQVAGNGPANAYVPSDAQLSAFRSARNLEGVSNVRSNPLLRYVTGRSGLAHPSTDELIQWIAHKWGIPEAVIRAQLTQESGLRMSQLGDRRALAAAMRARYPARAQIAGSAEAYESMGIAQVKWIPDGSVGAGTEPLRWQSTAFNLDYYAATLRYYYDGYCHWCGPGYTAGQRWNSVGAWFSPNPWANPAAARYVASVRRLMAQEAPE